MTKSALCDKTLMIVSLFSKSKVTINQNSHQCDNKYIFYIYHDQNQLCETKH